MTFTSEKSLPVGKIWTWYDYWKTLKVGSAPLYWSYCICFVKNRFCIKYVYNKNIIIYNYGYFSWKKHPHNLPISFALQKSLVGIEQTKKMREINMHRKWTL